MELPFHHFAVHGSYSNPAQAFQPQQLQRTTLLSTVRCVTRSSNSTVPANACITSKPWIDVPRSGARDIVFNREQSMWDMLVPFIHVPDQIDLKCSMKTQDRQPHRSTRRLKARSNSSEARENQLKRPLDTGLAKDQNPRSIAQNDGRSSTDSDFANAEPTINLEEDTSSDDSSFDLGTPPEPVSSASSYSQLGSDVLELLLSELLAFQDLWYLWPQLVASFKSRKDFHILIARFIELYADDLENLAIGRESGDDPRYITKGLQEITAARFVRKSRLAIAQRVWAVHKPVATGVAGVWASEEGDFVEKPDDSVDDYIPFAFSEAKDFLFETLPIIALQSRVKRFVSERHETSILSAVTEFLTIRVENVFHQVAPPESGNYRIFWKCRCGKRSYDDFKQLESGGVNDLTETFRTYANEDHLSEGCKQEMRSSPGWRRWIGKSSASSSAQLPFSQKSSVAESAIGSCHKTSQIQRNTHNYVLLCVPFMKKALKLHNAEVCKINSDREFFRMLRYYYTQHCPRKRFSIPKRVQALNFVHFEVYRSKLVDILSTPSLPPNDQPGTDYMYEPMPPATNPPVGPNLLMHLFEHPDHAEVTPVLYKRIPRKLRAKLEACPIQGSSAGWGIHYVEGLDRLTMYIYGCVGFAIALVMAVIWASIRDDVQGGFAIAGFLIAFLAFCGSLVQSEFGGF
ncbi:uncharacterized protein E0L32_006131 [Thyridium curvatum]|uniref:Uncharacterized protein n=1 Tax=Thyridium curvatum TaxID=1093900 RepID=A0A507B8K7_9PEZI|nr:uncharacterized protein E0L32_006131 [Thyridium curvatum]TPX13401.1 hypothetical protein E0L32_006131 [Thyridium curvatum]